MSIRLKLFFALQRLIGSRAGDRYHEFLEMERWPVERLNTWREKRLRDLLQHAATNIPYYKKKGIDPHAPLEAFPIITKDRLHESYTDMMVPTLRSEYQSGRKRRGYGWMEVTSGGTTGIPTTVIHDTDFRDMDRAARLYNQHLSGFPFGTPHYKLWGAVEDIRRLNKSFSQKLMAWLSNESLLNAFQMEDERIDRYLNTFREKPRAYMLAYVDALEQLVKYAQSHNHTLPSFRSIITTGGTLTEDTEELLRDAFQTRIHNQYGSRDCGALACSCEQGNLHILAPNIYIEVLDDNDQPVAAGEPGRVLVTFLGNHAFPIIRFDIGDIAIAGSGECSCGRSFPILKRVMARKTDVIQSTTGGYISPVYIRHIIGVEHGQRKFRRYQFIQHDHTQYELVIQPEAGQDGESLKEVLSNLKKDLQKVIGNGAEITVSFNARIPEASSGKFRYVVNNFSPNS